MSDLIITLLLDSFLAILLIVTIGYCARLSKRIRLLQDSRGELATMIAQFDTATVKATHSLAELQGTSKRVIDALQLKIEKANFLADDLAFLIEKSTKLAAQLEQAKEQRVPVSPPVPAAKARPFFETQGLSEKPPEKTKIPADRMATAHAYPGTYPGSTSKTIPSLEAVLQRLASGAPSSETTPAFMSSSSASTSQKMAPRTDAERQLLEALKPDR